MSSAAISPTAVSSDDSSSPNHSYGRRLQDYCFLKALKAAVSAFPRNDCMLRYLTCSFCPQGPCRCMGNACFVTLSSIISLILRGPHLFVTTLWVQPRLYRLYRKYLQHGTRVEGRILSQRPTSPSSRTMNTVLVHYSISKTEHYVKYMAHAATSTTVAASAAASMDDDDDDDDSTTNQEQDNTIPLLVLLPDYPKSACSQFIAEEYVTQHSSYKRMVVAILWALWCTIGISLLILIPLLYWWEQQEDEESSTVVIVVQPQHVCISMSVIVGIMFLLMAFYQWIRQDPVEQFMLFEATQVNQNNTGVDHDEEEQAGPEVEEQLPVVEEDRKLPALNCRTCRKAGHQRPDVLSMVYRTIPATPSEDDDAAACFCLRTNTSQEEPIGIHADMERGQEEQKEDVLL